MSKRIFLFVIIATAVITAGTIDLNNLDNYANQPVPAYIIRDNMPVANQITDAGATLGRVLFYDKQLSIDNSISCASCHKQQFAFGDTAVQSVGVDGVTGRHSMRLVNSRFSEETKFFWDERANSLEDQSTMPIQDHIEMGFSGSGGDPDLDSLIRKMNQLEYYNRLFEFVYGDTIITEERIQNALAQFIRSIQSFDSRFDAGRAMVANDGANFPNYSALENLGKTIFLAPPPQGAGCQGCHRAPEFDIDPNSLNNGEINVAGGGGGTDLTNTRAPSLRDLFNPNGMLNGRLFHSGVFNNIQLLINHYNAVPQIPGNTNLDPRLQGPPLNLTQQEKDALEAFLRTLTGSNIYTDPKWSDPFDLNGNIDLILVSTAITHAASLDVNIYPNPAKDYISIELPDNLYNVNIMNMHGQVLRTLTLTGSDQIDLSGYPSGTLLIEVTEKGSGKRTVKKINLMK